MKKTSTPISPRTSTGMDFPESESRALAATFPAMMRNGGSRLNSSRSVEQQRRIVTLAHEIAGPDLGADDIQQTEDLLLSQNLGAPDLAGYGHHCGVRPGSVQQSNKQPQFNRLLRRSVSMRRDLPPIFSGANFTLRTIRISRGSLTPPKRPAIIVSIGPE